MKTLHTPGPWFSVDYAGSFCIQDGPMYEDKDILSYDSLAGKEYSVPIETAEANAKLAAAAPELLESLRELVQSIKTRTAIGNDIIHELIQAEESIKKATGQ